MSENQKEDFSIMYPRLVKLPLFAAFSEKTEENERIMKMIYEKFSLKLYKKGQNIITEGEVGNEFYILYSGNVRIFRKTLSGDIISLANLTDKMNVFFGEPALVSENLRNATIAADSDCSLIILNREDFISICEKEPVIGYKVLMCIAQRMANTINKTNNDVSTLYEALFNEIDGSL